MLPSKPALSGHFFSEDLPFQALHHFHLISFWKKLTFSCAIWLNFSSYNIPQSQFIDINIKHWVWLQHTLSWDKHISEMISKSNRRLYMLRMLKRFGFKKDELITVYKGYIRPLLEYADVVWNSSLTLQQTKTIEQVQRRACRIVVGHNFSSYNKALSDCEIESLATRRENPLPQVWWRACWHWKDKGSSSTY